MAAHSQFYAASRGSTELNRPIGNTEALPGEKGKVSPLTCGSAEAAPNFRWTQHKHVGLPVPVWIALLVIYVQLCDKGRGKE